MALTLLATNNAESALASAISATDTSLIVSAGTGAEFPDAVDGVSYFKLTIIDAATGGQIEIVNVTAKAGDIFTIERAQEGTLARAWSANDFVANMMTADTLNVIAEFSKQAADSAEEAKGYALSASEFGDNKFTFYKTESDPDGTIAGLAATTDGQSFRVAQGVDGTDAFITYQNDNGVAVAQAAQPGTVAIIGTVREFPTLTAAQADATAGNILAGAKCWITNSSDVNLADEYINNGGTLQPTGREMPSQQSIDQKIEFDDFQVLSKLKDDAGNECFHVDAFGQMFFVKVGSKSLQDTLSSIAETVSRDKSANLHDFPDLNHQRVAFLDDTGNLYIPGLGNFSVQDKIRDLDALVGKDRNKNISRNYDQDGQLINLQDEDGKLYLPGLGSKSVQDSIKDIRAHYDHDRA
ncbi:hypothetical protein ACQKFC_08475, partial [Raoultella planticola]